MHWPNVIQIGLLVLRSAGYVDAARDVRWRCVAGADDAGASAFYSTDRLLEQRNNLTATAIKQQYWGCSCCKFSMTITRAFIIMTGQSASAAFLPSLSPISTFNRARVPTDAVLAGKIPPSAVVKNNKSTNNWARRDDNLIRLITREISARFAVYYCTSRPHQWTRELHYDFRRSLWMKRQWLVQCC